MLKKLFTLKQSHYDAIKNANLVKEKYKAFGDGEMDIILDFAPEMDIERIGLKREHTVPCVNSAFLVSTLHDTIVNAINEKSKQKQI